jgi:hypothetical protein
MRARSDVLVALFVVVAAVGALSLLAQSTFPVRLGGEPEPLAPTMVDSVSAPAVRLVPQTERPIVCDVSTVGHLYVQIDTTNADAQVGHILCVCTAIDAGGFQFRPPNSTINCADFSGVCLDLLEGCSSDGQCCSGHCGTTTSQCCLPAGAGCLSSLQCCSLNCEGNICGS